MPKSSALASIASLGLLAACSDYDVVRLEQVDTFVQEPAEEVDILMIVDNSGSMEPYQTKLGTSFDQFITYFVDANVDYHIGITTTDVASEPLPRSPDCPNPTNPARGALIGTIITPETNDPSSAFQQIVNVGTCGSGNEQGLEAALLALTEPRISGANEGFLREDAALSIIFVSDEEDNSPLPVNDYINRFFAVKGQRARDVFNASALTVTDESACTAAQAAASSAGTRYVDVGAQTHGLLGNLCADAVSFEEIVTDLSLNASRLTNTFYLSKEPDAGSITVTVDDSEIDCAEGAWWYERVELDGEEVPAVVFDLADLPSVGAHVAVRYNSGDGSVERFCVGGEE